MTLKKITSMALVLGMITANTGCAYQAELTEFLDDPTGMKAEAEMTTEYEMPPDETEYEFYEYEYEEIINTSDTAESLITTPTQETKLKETSVTAVSAITTAITTTFTDITESAEEETEITTSAETDDIIFASAEPTEETEPTEEIIEWEESTEQPTEEATEPPAEEETENTELSDYQKALEIYEYMNANGAGTCVQHSYQTYRMCLEYGLPCYFIWTDNRLYGHVANAVCVEGVWYVLDTQAGCFLTENMCGFTEIVDENENYIMSADNISQTRY